MIQLPELTNPTTAKTIALLSSAWSIGEQVYTAVKSDRAITIYHSLWNAAKTTVLLTIAAALLTVDAGKALRSLYEARKDKDFTKLATAKVQAVATVVKGCVKEQRDRSSIFIRSSAQRIEQQARNQVGDVLLTLGDKVLPSCPNGICPVNADAV